MTAGVGKHECRQVIAGSSAGQSLVEPDRTIAYANAAALAMHGPGNPDELDPTVGAYRARLWLRYRNHITPAWYPIERVAADEGVEIDQEAFALPVAQDIIDSQHADRNPTKRTLSDPIEAAMEDTSWLSRGLTGKLTNLRRPKTGRSDALISSLTTRERQILKLICSGLDDATIARRLDLSRSAVRNHAAALSCTFGVHKRSEAVVADPESDFP